MTSEEQCLAFEADLDRLIDRYFEEFDLPLVSVIGMLHVKLHEITLQAFEDDEDD